MNGSDTIKYFRVLTDDVKYSDRWFLKSPQTADTIRLDVSVLASDRVKRWQTIRNNKKVEVHLVTMDSLRYPLTVYLDGVCEIDPREFTEGRNYLGPPPHRIPVHEGRCVAFNLGSLDMPVVTTEIADFLQELAPDDIERFPVTIGSDMPGYEIINAIHQRRCVDEERSGVTKWTLQDHRADLAGEYRAISHLMIDPSRTEGSHIFRLWGSEIRLIVSEEVKRALEPIENLGIVFSPVT